VTDWRTDIRVRLAKNAVARTVCAFDNPNQPDAGWGMYSDLLMFDLQHLCQVVAAVTLEWKEECLRRKEP